MREITLQDTQNCITLQRLDRYGRVIEQIDTDTTSIQLDSPKLGQKWRIKGGDFIYPHDGAGVLEKQDSLIDYKFDANNEKFLSALDFALNNNGSLPKSTPKSIAKKVSEFVEVYEKNIAKNDEYLLPKGFVEVESAFMP